jgi:Xaa-Pro dipeptidase
MPDQQEIYRNRQTKLATVMKSSGMEMLILNAGPSLLYLTGLNFHLSERPVLLVFAPPEVPIIILPELEAGKVQVLQYPIQTFTYGEDPHSWPVIIKQALHKLLSSEKLPAGIEPRRMRALELGLLKEALDARTTTSAEELLATLRMHKDTGELAAMQKATAVAQAALMATLPSIRIGMSEKELAAELVLQILRNGSDPELPFMPIVSAGPNSANPHAVPTQRPLQSGDLLVIDWGASCDGYFSDLTRTFAVGEVETELQTIAEIVHQANSSAQAACRPGVSCGAVDEAARHVIERAGYGQFFTHRTGHGLGMESHEEPYMRAGNPMALAPGMTFTIEPGIYLPGRNGVRIEDNMAITIDGAQCLSDLPRQLLQVG